MEGKGGFFGRFVDRLSDAPAESVGGQYVHIPQAPIQSFINECGRSVHPTSQEVFERLGHSTLTTLGLLDDTMPAFAAPSSSRFANIGRASTVHENAQAISDAAGRLLDEDGECRLHISANGALLQKMGERASEATRIAMARGLLRHQNSNIDAKGDLQVVGEIPKLDVTRCENEREEIVALMKRAKEMRSARCN